MDSVFFLRRNFETRKHRGVITARVDPKLVEGFLGLKPDPLARLEGLHAPKGKGHEAVR